MSHEPAQGEPARGATSRRAFLAGTVALAGAALLPRGLLAAAAAVTLTSPLARDWLARWEKNIVGDARNRYCDREMGEEIGWLVSPFLNGFYYGYLATLDTKWLDLLVDWSDAWMKRGVQEPDGCIGWPKAAGASTGAVPDFVTDNILGEAMGLAPAVGMAATVQKTPALKEKYGRKAREYLDLAERTFAKWDARGAWREVKEGGLWVVPPFGIDPKTGQWTEGYERRKTDGFSLPANKQNTVARWLIDLHEATGKAVYRERAEAWFRRMKACMRPRDEKYYVWNYWDPAGPWDRKPDGSLKHWVGVHPNGGYYALDMEGIVAAHERGLVFGKEDLERLIATNRDFMWNQKVEGAKFQRIDGGQPDDRWKNSPGVLWTALAPYDATLRKVFEANHDPAGWGGLAETPRYLAHLAGRLPAGRADRPAAGRGRA